MGRKPLSALVYRGTSGLFVALCLDHDIAAQGETPVGAIGELEKSYRAHLRISERRGEPPFKSARRAPEEYWGKFQSAEALEGASSTFDQVRAVADS